MFISIVHTIVNFFEMGYFRFIVSIQRNILRLKSSWNKFQIDQTQSQTRVLAVQSNLPASYTPSEGISSEYCECLLMLGWGLLFAAAFPIASVILTIAFLARCRLLLHCMLASRTNMLPHFVNAASHWLMVLKFVIAAAVFTNATILAFVSKNVEVRHSALAFSDDLQASFSSVLCAFQLHRARVSRLECIVIFSSFVRVTICSLALRSGKYSLELFWHFRCSILLYLLYSAVCQHQPCSVAWQLNSLKSRS